AKDLASLKPGGRILFIAALAGADVQLPIFELMRKRAIVTGSLLRPRTPDEKAAIAEGVEQLVWPWLDAGAMRPPVDRIFPLDAADAAHSYLEKGGHFGKIVLRCGE